MDEFKYMVYFRNEKYHVCKECYKNMLSNSEIIEDGLWYYKAAQIANNLNWEKICKENNLVNMYK